MGGPCEVVLPLSLVHGTNSCIFVDVRALGLPAGGGLRSTTATAARRPTSQSLVFGISKIFKALFFEAVRVLQLLSISITVLFLAVSAPPPPTTLFAAARFPAVAVSIAIRPDSCSAACLGALSLSSPSLFSFRKHAY